MTIGYETTDKYNAAHPAHASKVTPPRVLISPEPWYGYHAAARCEPVTGYVCAAAPGNYPAPGPEGLDYSPIFRPRPDQWESSRRRAAGGYVVMPALDPPPTEGHFPAYTWIGERLRVNSYGPSTLGLSLMEC